MITVTVHNVKKEFATLRHAKAWAHAYKTPVPGKAIVSIGDSHRRMVHWIDLRQDSAGYYKLHL